MEETLLLVQEAQNRLNMKIQDFLKFDKSLDPPELCPLISKIVFAFITPVDLKALWNRQEDFW